MDIFKIPKYVLFTFPDGTHYAMRTTLNTDLVPTMEPGCLYNMDKNINIPVSFFEEAERQVLDEYPEKYREESEFYEKLLYGV